MNAHRIIVILVIILVGIGLYKLTMYYLKKSKRFSAVFKEEKKQTLRARLDELFKKRDELKSLRKSVKAEEELVGIEKEINGLTKQLNKLETKRGSK
jgi:hypothetical protein